jgi:hypothetical protein
VSTSPADSRIEQCHSTTESTAESSIPAVVGRDLRVPLVTGGTMGYANLDHAASAPCLESVQEAVNELLPWYASVHRGAGFASQVCTRIYDGARETLRRFVGASPADAVVLTRNTTDSLNLLARALPPKTSVIVFDSDHHAALCPGQGFSGFPPRLRSPKPSISWKPPAPSVGTAPARCWWY